MRNSPPSPGKFSLQIPTPFLHQHLRVVEYPSFCFCGNLVFQLEEKKDFSLCEHCIVTVCWYLNFSVYAVCHHAKLCLIHGHFQHRMYAHFLTFFCKVLMLASFAESLHFVSLDQCSQGTAWLKTTTPDEDVSQEILKDKTHHYTIARRSTTLLYELSFYSNTFKLVTCTKLVQACNMSRNVLGCRPLPEFDKLVCTSTSKCGRIFPAGAKSTTWYTNKRY